jgi:SAM-dependent methyltransferase
MPGYEALYSPDRCNICGSKRHRTVCCFDSFEGRGSKYDGVSVVQCLGCGVRRRNPALQDDYEEEYHAPYVDQGAAIHAHIFQHFSDLMTLKFADFRTGVERFLDVGCSTGRVLQLAKVMGFAATGLDLSRWAADHCRKLGFESRCGSLIGQWSDGGIFDVIHCSHSIEHVPDPVAYLFEMHRLLMPGGLLMLAFPNYQSIQRFYWGKKWPIWCLDSHLWQFSLRQMAVLCRCVGLQPITMRALHGYEVNSKILKFIFDFGSSVHLGDGAQIIAQKTRA